MVIRFLLFISLLFTTSWGEAQRYFIRLGSFKQLPVLQNSIHRLPPDLREHVVIVRSHGWFIPFAYNTPRRASLERKLPEFKRYFPDAYVDKTARILHAPVVQSYLVDRTPPARSVTPTPEPIIEQSYSAPPAPARVTPSYQEEYTASYVPPTRTYTPPPPTVTVSRPVQIPKQQVNTAETKAEDTPYFTKRMLSGKHFFLAYKSTQNSPNLLVKVTFENHRVKYQPIIGDMQLRDANYIVDNRRLYMFADTFSENGAYSKLEAKEKKYLLVSSWSNGKKLNTLRYYYHLNDAKRYLNLDESQDPLSSALTEGDEFDALDIDDENY